MGDVRRLPVGAIRALILEMRQRGWRPAPARRKRARRHDDPPLRLVDRDR